MLAIRLQSDRWKLTDDEADQLDKAVKRVWKHYPANVTQKQLDIGMACYTVATIYGARVIGEIADRKSGKRDAVAEPTAQNVFKFEVPQ